MSVFELTLITLTIIMGGSIVWYTLMLGISPMPSTKKAQYAMLKLVDDTGTGPIFELGSGWGNLLIPLAKKYPQRQIVGYELSFVPWLSTLFIAKLLGLDNITILRINFLQANLSTASVILCYLFPGGMNSLEHKLKVDSGKLKYLISNNFSLPSHTPAKTIQLDDFYHSPVYLYKFKKRIKTRSD